MCRMQGTINSRPSSRARFRSTFLTSRSAFTPQHLKLITLKFPDTTKEGDTWKFEVERSQETAGIYTCLGLRGPASYHSTPCNITYTPEEHFLSTSTATVTSADPSPSQNKGFDSLYALLVIPILSGLVVFILYKKPTVRKAVRMRMSCTRGRSYSQDQSTQESLRNSRKVAQVHDS